MPSNPVPTGRKIQIGPKHVSTQCLQTIAGISYYIKRALYGSPVLLRISLVMGMVRFCILDKRGPVLAFVTVCRSGTQRHAKQQPGDKVV